MSKHERNLFQLAELIGNDDAFKPNDLFCSHEYVTNETQFTLIRCEFWPISYLFDEMFTKKYFVCNALSHVILFVRTWLCPKRLVNVWLSGNTFGPCQMATHDVQIQGVLTRKFLVVFFLVFPVK